MKMTSDLVQQTIAQLNARAIPENHGALAKLQELFGDHTFFIDINGLNIVEADHARDGRLMGTVYNLASWCDDNLEQLVTHEPQEMEFEIVLARLH